MYGHHPSVVAIPFSVMFLGSLNDCFDSHEEYQQWDADDHSPEKKGESDGVPSSVEK
jgi:hypothetical protein